EHRKILAREIAQGMALAMPECYEGILRSLQQRGVQPVVLTVRTVDGPGHHLPGLNSAYAGLAPERGSTHSAYGDMAESFEGGEPADLMLEHRRAGGGAGSAARAPRGGRRGGP